MSKTTNEPTCPEMKLCDKQDNQLAILKKAIEAGENSGESDLSLQDIVTQIKKQAYLLNNPLPFIIFMNRCVLLEQITQITHD